MQHVTYMLKEVHVVVCHNVYMYKCTLWMISAIKNIKNLHIVGSSSFSLWSLTFTLCDSIPIACTCICMKWANYNVHVVKAALLKVGVYQHSKVWLGFESLLICPVDALSQINSNTHFILIMMRLITIHCWCVLHYIFV